MRFSPLSLAMLGVFVAGCGVSTLPMRSTSDKPISLQAKKGVETSVSKERLQASLGVLAGKTAIPGSKTIPERGSAEGRLMTRTYLASALESLGYKVERQGYRKTGENLFVRLMADKPTDEYILVGAHLDSVKNAGANDNGTGSSAVLEVATVLKGLSDRKVNVILAFFDEEELGLIGSYAMAREFKRQGLRVTSVHTIDMMGWDSDKDRTVEIEQPDGGLWDYYRMVNDRHDLKVPLKRTSSGSTDHVAFRSEGFEAVGLCEEWAGGDTTPYYHKKTDTFETVDFDFLASSTRLLAATVGDLAMRVPAPPASARLPHFMFPGRERHFHQH